MQPAAGFGSLGSKQGHYLHSVLRVLETQSGEGLFRFIYLGLFRVSRSQGVSLDKRQKWLVFHFGTKQGYLYV